MLEKAAKTLPCRPRTRWKTPCLVDRDASLEVKVRPADCLGPVQQRRSERVAPDYVLVHEAVELELLGTYGLGDILLR